VNWLYEYLVRLLFWNMILRMILEGYMEYALSSIENVENVKVKFSYKIYSFTSII